MRKPARPKLAVGRDTVRALVVADLKRVNGGDSEATCVTHLAPPPSPLSKP
jgi:hypothetical protein